MQTTGSSKPVVNIITVSFNCMQSKKEKRKERKFVERKTSMQIEGERRRELMGNRMTKND
jgi:hypothetical protein